LHSRIKYASAGTLDLTLGAGPALKFEPRSKALFDRRVLKGLFAVWKASILYGTTRCSVAIRLPTHVLIEPKTLYKVLVRVVSCVAHHAKFIYSPHAGKDMEITLLFSVKVILAIAIFIIMVRFIFSSSREEEESRFSATDIKEEIDDIKRSMKNKDITPKETTELMDSLMEEYYMSEKKSH